MEQFDDLERSCLPYSAMSICFCLLNEARIYINGRIEEKNQILTQLINHIGTITTRDFQIETSDLYKPVEPCMDINPNILVNVLWNYSSHFLNLLHPQYQRCSFIDQEKLLENLDVEVLQGFLNHVAERKQIERVFTKTELLERIYNLQKQKQKVLGVQ